MRILVKAKLDRIGPHGLSVFSPAETLVSGVSEFFPVLMTEREARGAQVGDVVELALDTRSRHTGCAWRITRFLKGA